MLAVHTDDPVLRLVRDRQLPKQGKQYVKRARHGKRSSLVVIIEALDHERVHR